MQTHLAILREEILEEFPPVAIFLVLHQQEVLSFEVVRIKVCPWPNVSSFRCASHKDSWIERRH